MTEKDMRAILQEELLKIVDTNPLHPVIEAAIIEAMKRVATQVNREAPWPNACPAWRR